MKGQENVQMENYAQLAPQLLQNAHLAIFAKMAINFPAKKEIGAHLDPPNLKSVPLMQSVVLTQQQNSNIVAKGFSQGE